MSFDTIYPPAAVPSGRTTVNGAEMVHGPDGALLPVGTVKPQHLMEDELVRQEIGHAIALSEQIARFRAHVHDNISAFEALIAEAYGAKVGGKKGNKTLMTYDGLMKMTVQVTDNVVFGPELQVAKQLVDTCLTDWSATSGDELKAVITCAFAMDREGQVNRGALYSLLRREIADERWRQAMKAIRDAMRIVGSKEYVRFHRRADSQAAWEPVTIDLARA